MVAIAKNEKQTDAGIVCPVCFRPVSRAAMTGGDRDAYGRITRSYFGWCLECSFGFEVIQFYKENTKTGWLIHQYRLFAIFGENATPQPTTKWRLVNELPEVPLVVTGPGGDFNNCLTNEQVIDATETVLNALRSMTKTVEMLFEFAKRKK